MTDFFWGMVVGASLMFLGALAVTAHRDRVGNAPPTPPARYALATLRCSNFCDFP